MNRAYPATVAALSLLAACSGSGNGSGDAPAADINITSANAMAATRISYQAALASNGLGDLSGETGFIAVGPDGVAKAGGSVFASANSGLSRSQVPIPEQVSACAGGGTVTINADIADILTPTLSPGDTFNVAFDMCDDGLGTVTDGVLDYVVDAFSGAFLGQLYDLTMSLTLADFQITTAADVLTSNGDATVTLNTINAPAVSASVSGNSLTVDSNSSSETLWDFATAQTLDAGIFPSPYTMTASGTLDSTQLSGVVSYSTPVMFEGFDTDYPNTGEFLVNGNNSSARLIAVDNVNVRIELDTNGDNVIDETINTTWAALTDAI